MNIKQFVAASVLAAQTAAISMTGVNIGGWMVLEPWITPSLFYRWLGKTKSEGIAVDSWTFCEQLGPVEGNKVMRAHWDAWLTEEHIQKLAERDVEIVRLPIGDWTTTAYGPYIGCMDGAREKITWFLDTCAKYNIKVLLDVHALKDSQNGFDNSGKAADIIWSDETHFNHWDHQVGHWMGSYNFETQKYDIINWSNIIWGIDNVRNLMLEWGNHPAVYALEPANEPWQNSDMPTLKTFYRQVRNVIREINPKVKFVFHDAFQPKASVWNDLFADDDIENTILDNHTYLAWVQPRSDNIRDYIVSFGNTLLSDEFKNIKYEKWVGEWSLATDICAWWLGGFNESYNFPYQFDCEWIDCPRSYLPSELAVDFDRTAPLLGPHGMSDRALIRNGQCARDSAFFSKADVQVLADGLLDMFDQTVQGQFLWTFRNEMEDKWNYITAYDLGWLNRNKSRSFLQ